MASFGLNHNILNENRLKVNDQKVLKKGTGLAVRKPNQEVGGLKRNALSQATNLINKPNKLNENEKKDQVKVSSTELGFVKPELKPLATKTNVTNTRIKVETRNSLKLNTTASKIPKPLTKESKERLNREKGTSLLEQSKSKVSSLPTKKVQTGPTFSSFQIPENVENIDTTDGDNALLAPNLSNDIYMYIRELENKLALPENFLAKQTQMTPRMRSRLVDWIIAIHHQFKLLPETLYLTVALMDRFFECEVVSKDKIQLCGVTAFFIASKYEEIYPPEVRDFLSICDSCTKQDLLKMEITFLRTLKFDLSNPLPLHFLRRFSKAAHADSRIHTMAKYLMELSLIEYDCSHWKPSLLAATSLYLTLQLIAENPAWNDTLVFYSNYTEKQLLPHVSTICKLLIKTQTSRYQSCFRKYSSPKLMQISCSEEFSSDYVKEMAVKF